MLGYYLTALGTEDEIDEPLRKTPQLSLPDKGEGGKEAVLSLMDIVERRIHALYLQYLQSSPFHHGERAVSDRVLVFLDYGDILRSGPDHFAGKGRDIPKTGHGFVQHVPRGVSLFPVCNVYGLFFAAQLTP